MHVYILCMTKDVLFSSENRRVAQALGSLGFANPFGSRRFSLESQVFGVDARSVGPLGGREARRALRDRVRPLIYGARERSREVPRSTLKNLSFMRDLFSVSSSFGMQSSSRRLFMPSSMATRHRILPLSFMKPLKQTRRSFFDSKG